MISNFTDIFNVYGGDADDWSDITLISNIYENGIGIATYDGDIKGMSDPNDYNSRYKVTSIYLPKSITILGTDSFCNCVNLKKIIIPDSVTGINIYAFSGCYMTKNNFINHSSLNPEDNDYWGLQLIDEEREDGLCIKDNEVIRCRTWITNVVIPDSVTSIRAYAFSNCVRLSSITIPASVTSIGSSIFEYCYMLESNFINNSQCTSTYNWELTFVDIEQEDGLCIKDNKAFSCRHWATNIVIPDSVTSIGYAAFKDCSSLISITIPDSVTSIANDAFYSCSSLTSITIPASVTSIGGSAFYDCSSLTSVTCEATVPPTLSYSVFGNTNDCPIYVPTGSVSRYKTATNWKTYANRIFAIPE